MPKSVVLSEKVNSVDVMPGSITRTIMLKDIPWELWFNSDSVANDLMSDYQPLAEPSLQGL